MRASTLTGIIPVLRLDDVCASARYYRDVLGVNSKDVHEVEGKAVRGDVFLSKGRLMCKSALQTGGPSAEHLSSGVRDAVVER